ncbi:MAG TPA: peptidoglycan-binding domain-containing protein [Candidatus Udaeobacter sp.]
MNRSAFSAFFVVAALPGSFQIATGQMINPTVQTASTRVVASRSAPATAAKPVASARVRPQVAPRPTGLNPQRFNANLPRTIAQPPANLQRTYAPPVRTSNFGVATLNAPHGGAVQQPIRVDPSTRQTELRTLAAMRQRGVVTRDGNILDPATRQNEIHTLATMREHRGLVPGQANTLDSATRETESRTLQKMRGHRGIGTDNQTLATINPQRHVTNRDPEAGSQRDKPDGPKDAHGKKWHNKKDHNKKDHINHDDAFRRHWHEWHDRNWWHNNCQTIVFVSTGYYFLDGSYWYPAYGYDPLQTYYDYDGPIYTYSNLLPDEVIANVQTALQDAGYYYGPITGSLSVDTRAAIANFQRDYGLSITGAIDEPTVEALGLDQADDSYNFQTDQGY